MRRSRTTSDSNSKPRVPGSASSRPGVARSAEAASDGSTKWSFGVLRTRRPRPQLHRPGRLRLHHEDPLQRLQVRRGGAPTERPVTAGVSGQAGDLGFGCHVAGHGAHQPQQRLGLMPDPDRGRYLDARRLVHILADRLGGRAQFQFGDKSWSNVEIIRKAE